MPHSWLSLGVAGKGFRATGGVPGRRDRDGFGDLMAFRAAIADRPLPRRIGRSDRTALVLAALAMASGAAAWISSSAETAPFATAALPAKAGPSSFEDRFVAAGGSAWSARDTGLQPLDRLALLARQIKVRDAKAYLAEQLVSGDWRMALEDAPRPASAAVPLPRSRPVVADVGLRTGPALALAEPSPPPERTLLQKISDMLPGRVRLASLTPDSGLFRQGPDLAALGYDGQTAVYDISARAVYLPNGASLEAHSGLGSLKDDPEHVQQRMAGATPPGAYELKLREKLFHGVRALRMIPVDGSDTLGRSGLLAHSYMLGPNGDSNGCVSIRDYERFVKAFDDGEINRLVVVPSLNGAVSAAQRSTSQS